MRHLFRLLLITLFAGSCVQAQTADPKPLVEKALLAVGGKEKLLKVFRIQETFHFGATPEPDAGKKRSNRDSILSQPDMWWINKKERGPDPAKDDARAWSLDLLVDEKSRFEIIPDLTDEGRPCVGLRMFWRSGCFGSRVWASTSSTTLSRFRRTRSMWSTEP